MATEIKLPVLGEGLKGGDVLEVKVAVGDQVQPGQTLVEIEAEKSTVEVPAPMPGMITQILVKKGDAVTVGQPLCLFESQETSAAPAAPPAAAPASRLPDAAPAAPPAAKPARVPAGDGASIPVEPRRAERPVPPAAAPAAGSDGERVVPAGPATRRLARELGVELHRVKGTGPGGRVGPEDVKAFVRELAAQPQAEELGTIRVPPLPDFERWGRTERRPLDGVRRKTAEQMALAWNLIPHVTQHDLVDVTDVDAFRRQQEGKGPKLTVTAFALKAAAIALKQFPQFNATLDLGNQQLILKHYYHVGVAVDTERGLLVPVLRDVDRKSVLELAQEMADVAEKARQKKLQPEDLRGGTFTITNLGGIGGTGFTPIVNWPEVAILGMARARLTPVVRDGQIVPRLLLPLSLSYDHRVIDGADAARFVRRLAEMLENPWQMVALA